jgi:hypothetical protein
MSIAQKLLDQTELSIFPHHHLVSAESLYPRDSEFRVKYFSEMSNPNSSSESRFQLYRQALAFNGVSAKEAVLLDDIDCGFAEEIGGEPIKFDWKVLYDNCLEGCAENYLSEIFVCKQRIFEAGDKLQTSLEINAEDMTSNMSAEVAAYLQLKTFDKFIASGFTNEFNLSAKGKIQGSSDLRDDCIRKLTICRNRFDGYQVRSEKTDGREIYNEIIYRFRLTDYWLDWQRVARLSGFDFDFVKQFSDAKTIRFYELTKLCRVSKTMKSGDELPKKLKITYEKFVALMPLPKYNSEREIKLQIKELTDQLKKHGYLKSFSVKPGSSCGTDSEAVLAFTFND